MPKTKESKFTRKQLIAALNEDLSREYQAIITYVNYSQVLKGAAYMSIASQLEIHAKQELDHALKIRTRSTTSVACPRLRPSRSRPPKRPRRCSGSISRTSVSPLPTTAAESDSATPSTSLPLAKRSARSCSTNRITSRI